MAYEGWLCLNGVDIVNHCRMWQNIADGRGPAGITCRDCDPCCDDLAQAINGGKYNPVDAPWWDGTEDAADFAGLMVQSVTGLGPGEVSRSQDLLASGGSSFGRVQQAGPIVVVRALVLARTCCSNEFGIRWLRAALRNACGTNACTGADLTYLFCQPQTPDLDCPENEDFDFEAWIAPYYRTLKNVVLLSGPTVVETIPRGCPTCYDCGIPVVEFTLGSGRPCVYSDPVVGAPIPFDCTADDDDDCIEWVSGGDCDTIECANPEDCATDPDCVATVSPPSVPLVLNPCVEDCISTDVCCVTFQVPEGTFAQDASGTLDIEIFAGDLPLRRVKIQVWHNPTEVDVDELEDCDACTELNVSYVAPDSTLLVSGTEASSTIICPGGNSVRANPFIGGDRGAAVFGYPDLDGCGGNYTVKISANEPVASNAFARVNTVAKEC